MSPDCDWWWKVGRHEHVCDEGCRQQNLTESPVDVAAARQLADPRLEIMHELLQSAGGPCGACETEAVHYCAISALLDLDAVDPLRVKLGAAHPADTDELRTFAENILYVNPDRVPLLKAAADELESLRSDLVRVSGELANTQAENAHLREQLDEQRCTATAMTESYKTATVTLAHVGALVDEIMAAGLGTVEHVVGARLDYILTYGAPLRAVAALRREED